MASPQCCANPPTLDGASGQGAVVEDCGGLRAYVAGSPGVGVAIVLVSDVYGFEAPNLRKIADKVAAAGFFAVVPDFFYGDPFVAGSSLQDWIKIHSPVKGFDDAKKIVSSLKNKGITAFGAVGFCWGAKVVVELAKTAEIKAGVLLHPSLVTVDDIKEVKTHLAILGAETDRLSPPELVKEFEQILAPNPQVQSFVKIFPGVVHGWSVRYDGEDEVAVQKAEEAHRDSLDWLNKHLKSAPSL